VHKDEKLIFKGFLMKPSPRIFVSVMQDNHSLATPEAIQVKKRIYSELKLLDFEIEEFFVSGLATNITWTIAEVEKLLRRCQGAIFFGFGKWLFSMDNGSVFKFPSGYLHLEAGIATTKNIPSFVIKEAGVMEEGLFYNGGGLRITTIRPDGSDVLNGDPIFWNAFHQWAEHVKQRSHIFLGYSGGATSTAIAIRDFLEAHQVRVIDWKRDFQSATTIMEQIELAEKSCIGGIFLFTKDDKLAGKKNLAAPRDNVIFEAGYFVHAKGLGQVLIILENGAKLPADIGGTIYLPLEDRNNIQPIQDKILAFIHQNL
jgi:hypothetical protein